LPSSHIVIQSLWLGLANGMGYAVFALGLALVFGVLGVIRFDYGEFFMLGPMLLWALMTATGINFVVAAVLSVLIITALGFCVDRVAIQPFIETSPLMVFVSTLGISLILFNGASAIWGTMVVKVLWPFTQRVSAGGINITIERIILFIGGILLFAGLQLFLAKTTMGKLIRATAQNLTGAKLVGINTKKIYSLTIMLASAIAAVSGLLLGQVWQTYTGLGQSVLIIGFAVVVVAGMGSIKGCLAVGLIMGVAEALFSFIQPYLALVLVYALMVILLLWKPQGLFRKEF
jgi:branched-chain amino acid transport system permease protein